MKRSAGNNTARWLVLAAVGIGTYMSALDGSVVNTILPLITADFRTDVATIEWVVTTYLLVVSALLLTVGRLGDLRGNKNTYVSGFLVFVVGSALCGLSASPLLLTLSRAVQAVGAAMLFANSPAILTRNFPASQRGQALGLQATMTYLGLTTGPFLGGWLAGRFGWHSVFFINIPVGLIAIALAVMVIPRDAPSESTERFDVPGAALFAAGLVALLFALDQGHNFGWGSPFILGALLASVTLLFLFVRIESSTPAPMLDLRLFSERVFSISTISAVLNYVCVSSVLFLMPFYLIHGRGFSPAHTGLILISQPIVMAITAPLSGTLSDRIGSRLLTTIGMLVFAVGLLLLSRLSPAAPIGQAVLGLAICGFGTGLFVSPNNSALMGAAPRTRQGIAAGVLALGRSVGMALGIGFAGAVFNTHLGTGGTGNAGLVVSAIDASLVFACAVAVVGALVCFARSDDRPSSLEAAVERQ